MEGEIQLMTLEDAQNWAADVITAWKYEITTMSIGRSGNLMSALHYNITQGANSTFKVDFKFPFYGRFVDMGVGRGFPKGSVKHESVKGNRDKLLKYRNLKGQIINMNRFPKPWYTRTLDRKVAQLKILFFAFMREKSMRMLKTELEMEIRL